jgi:hypothetical protein
MKVFNSLDPNSPLKIAIDMAIGVLKEDPAAGNQVEKQLWPEKYIRKYQINNLFRYRLPDGWRLTYTVVTDEKSTISTILDVLDHTRYDRLFGYH